MQIKRFHAVIEAWLNVSQRCVDGRVHLPRGGQFEWFCYTMRTLLNLLY